MRCRAPRPASCSVSACGPRRREAWHEDPSTARLGRTARLRQRRRRRQIGWNARCEFDSDDFVDQVRQALLNVRAVLAEAGATPSHIMRMTWYLTDKREYLARAKEVGAVFREVIGVYHAAMTAVQVTALIEDRAKVEIEATAVVPLT